MLGAVYTNKHYAVVVAFKNGAEGIGMYDLLNLKTEVVEAKVSILPDAMDLADVLSKDLTTREAGIAPVSKFKEHKH